MAVEIKKVLLNMAEENAKVLLQQVVKPLLEEKIAANPMLAPVLLSLLAELEKAALGLIDQLDGEVG